MSVLLPAHDGIAAAVASALPDCRVIEWGAGVDLDEVTFCCLPYMDASGAAASLRTLPSLQVVQSLSIGVDDVAALLPPGVVLCNGRGLLHEESTAELVVLLVLASLRGLPAMVRQQAVGEWRHERGESLLGKRVLVVGYGGVGQEAARQLTALGADVQPVASRAREGVAAVDDLASLARAADVVVVGVPLTDATRGLISADVLAALPDGALVVNVARGPVVDAVALRAELVSGRLRAALDVTDPEPLPADAVEWSLPNCLITPHVGGDTAQFADAAREFVVGQVRRHLTDAPLVNVVS